MANPNKPASTTPSKAKTNKANQVTVGQALQTASTSTQAKAKARADYKLALLEARKLRERVSRYNRRRLALNGLGGDRCYPSTAVYGGNSRGNKKWICDQLRHIVFREQNYSVRECEFRVFVEGVEVTPYVRGAMSWTLQTTGGMNTCTFSLNNNHDAFILTPANVCSKLDLSGWRVPLAGKKRLVTTPGRITRNTDEVAKYLIYKRKYERIRPGAADQQIDEAGFWLYPLNPFHSVINKHDCVRVFYRLPHITGLCKIPGSKDYPCPNIKGQQVDELWAPAFTGFVDEYDFEDDPVMGDRLMNIRCYDWRGLLNRMRVRMQPTSSVSDGKSREDQNSAVFKEQREQAKKDKSKGISSTQSFLDVTSDLGINRDLNALYNAAVSAAFTAQCTKGQNYNACTKKAQDDIRGKVAYLVAQMKSIYAGGTVKLGADKQPEVFSGIVKSLAELKDATGVIGILKRTGKDTIKVEYSSKTFVSADEAIQKANSFLLTTGKKAADVAALYLGEYNSNRFVQTTSSVDLGNPQPRNNIFRLVNPGLSSLDNTVSSQYPDIYKNAKFAENPNTNRIYLLNQYVLTTVRGFFSDVPGKIQAEVDRDILATFNTAKLLLLSSAGGTIAILETGAIAKVSKIFTQYVSKNGGSIAKSKVAKAKIDDAVRRFNDLYAQIRSELKKAEQAEVQALRKDSSVRRRAENDSVRKKIEEARRQGANNPTKNSESSSTVADVTHTTARFNQIAVGMYGDLIRAANKNPHPLAGMSFEGAVEWLTLTHLPISKGYEDKLKAYDREALQKWNLNMVFGVIGRPLTYREVTEVGTKSHGDSDPQKAPYSPLHAFMHMLLPTNGTGALSIVQQDITHNIFGATTYDFQTRLELLNELCETLDYQFYVTPYGDLSFEFPNYNSLPYDYGRIFQGAYTVVKGIRSFKLASEQGELNTAWIITGKETERVLEGLTGSQLMQDTYKKTVIVANVLARRVGVRVRNINIKLPGVGSVFKNEGSTGQGEATRIAFGLLEIQRELGRMEAASVQHDFRPFMLPNRPTHVVHRQRMALVKSVSYSMVPLGECTTSLDLHYVRGLNNDGTFRHMAGGTRLPVDYSGLFTGDVSQNIRFGSNPLVNLPGNKLSAAARAARGATVGLESQALRKSVMETTGQRKPRDATNWSCGPYLKDRWLSASYSYADQVDTTFRQAQTYTNQTQGAGGSAGSLPVQPRGASNYIASRTQRPPPNKGNPESAASLDNTSLSYATSGGVDKNNPTKTKASSDYYGNLYNPWPYGRSSKKTSREFNQWGFYRYVNPNGRLSSQNYGFKGKDKYGGRRRHKGKFWGWHSGVDFYGSGIHGKTAYCPIAAHAANIMIGTGFTRYPSNKYIWSRTYSILEAPPTTAAILGPPSEGDKLFAIKKSGSYVFKYTSDGQGIKFKLDGVTKGIYDKIKEQYKFKPKINRNYGSHSGLVVQAFGYVTLPGNSQAKLACRLSYVHCGDLIPYPNQSGGKKYWIGDPGTPKDIRSIPPDTPFVKVGSSGTVQSHLHFGMLVYRPGAKIPAHEFSGMDRAGGDTSAYKEILKTNHEFLRTQMKMKLTGGVNNVNKNQLSSKWKRYFDRLNSSGRAKITTVDQAVDYMLSRSKKYRWSVNPNDWGVQTNPLFFFRPEQIIKDFAEKYKAYREARPENYFDTATGSSVCGNNSAVLRQKISLEYYACVGSARKIGNVRKKKAAKRACYTTFKANKAKLTQRKDVSGTPQQTGGRAYTEKTHRKLDAKVKAGTKQRGNRGANKD